MSANITWWKVTSGNTEQQAKLNTHTVSKIPDSNVEPVVSSGIIG
jgi:hypothetical protein